MRAGCGQARNLLLCPNSDQPAIACRACHNVQDMTVQPTLPLLINSCSTSVTWTMLDKQPCLLAHGYHIHLQLANYMCQLAELLDVVIHANQPVTQQPHHPAPPAPAVPHSNLVCHTTALYAKQQPCMPHSNLVCHTAACYASQQPCMPHSS